MIATTDTSTFRPGEFHEFQGAGKRFLYLVPAGAIFEVDEDTSSVLAELSQGGVSREELIGRMSARGLTFDAAAELVDEMAMSRVIVSGEPVHEALQEPPADFPLQSLVMNLTNQCNLSCTYCYEFGEDKVATPEGKPKFMDLTTAVASVDFLLAQSNADELPAIEGGGQLCDGTGAGAGSDDRFQPDDQRHAAHAGNHPVPLR
jgi:uncharacterized protein